MIKITELATRKDNDYHREGMLQVEYPNGLIFDVSWYGRRNGFIIYLIKDFDWENPIIKRAVKSKRKLEKEMADVFEIIAQQYSS